jgi:hypothetical protein
MTRSWPVSPRLKLRPVAVASVALQPTEVLPSANCEPEAGVQVTVTEPSTRSLAVGLVEGRDGAGGAGGFHRHVWHGGHDGAVVSTTAPRSSSVRCWSALSVAVQLTVVVVHREGRPDARQADQRHAAVDDVARRRQCRSRRRPAAPVASR